MYAYKYGLNLQITFVVAQLVMGLIFTGQLG